MKSAIGRLVWLLLRLVLGAVTLYLFYDVGWVKGVEEGGRIAARMLPGHLDKSYSHGEYDTLNKLLDGVEIRHPTATVQLVAGNRLIGKRFGKVIGAKS